MKYEVIINNYQKGAQLKTAMQLAPIVKNDRGQVSLLAYHLADTGSRQVGLSG